MKNVNANDLKLLSVGFVISITSACGVSPKAAKSAELDREIAKNNQLVKQLQANDKESRVGGQPGFIIISAAKTGEQNELPQAIELRLKAGRGAGGITPGVAQGHSRIELLPLVDFQGKFPQLFVPASGPDILNLGCSEDLVEKFAGPTSLIETEKDIRPQFDPILGTTVYSLWAKVILLCKSDKIQGSSLSLNATTVVMHDFYFKTPESIGTGARFEVSTRRLVLLGQNHIASIFRSRLFPAGNDITMLLTFEDTEGAGHLLLESTGDSVP